MDQVANLGWIKSDSENENVDQVQKYFRERTLRLWQLTRHEDWGKERTHSTGFASQHRSQRKSLEPMQNNQNGP